MDPAGADVNWNAEPISLLDTAADAVSRLEDGDIEASFTEEPGSPKSAHAGSDDADLSRATILEDGLSTSHTPGLCGLSDW
jgi:hypothetical protein